MTNNAFPEAWRRGVYEAIARRRDVRSFVSDPIPPSVLARMLAAAHQAGSVGFSQPWNFVVVENVEVRRKIRAHVEVERMRAADGFEAERRAKYLSFKLEGILEAPLNVCVTCDQERFGPAVIGRNTIPETALYSTCCAIQNLWLAARAEGIGVGWVSILEPAVLGEMLGIPAGIVPVAYLCLGFVERFPERPTLETQGWLPRLPLQDVVFHDCWGQPPSSELVRALELMSESTSAGDDVSHATASAQTVPASHDERSTNPEAVRKAWLLVYTGQGKGKTTAALGVVFRALGRGLRVAVVQFIKGKWKTGERLFAETIPGLTFLVMGQGFTWESDDISRDRNAAASAWATAKQLIAKGEHTIVVLDEITYAINYGFIDLDDVLQAFNDRPTHVHVIVTGRNAPEQLCAMADLVTNMEAVKHPFQQGIKAQPGIDY